VGSPILPAAVLLVWEGANGILPHVLQKMSVLYYLQSLCPVPAPMDDDVPTLVRLLAAPAAPASRPGAILGLLRHSGDDADASRAQPHPVVELYGILPYN